VSLGVGVSSTVAESVMKRLLFAAVAALVCVSVSTAQPSIPKPGPEHEMLKKMVGQWDMVAGEKGQEMKGTSTYTMEHGDLWLASKVQMDLGFAKFSGSGMDSYDANKKKFVSVWTDSMSTSPLVCEGTFDKDTKTMTLSGEGPGPDGKMTKHTMKTVWTDDDHYTFTMTMGDAKEPQMTIKYSRVKK
jgi:hypothetical protein